MSIYTPENYKAMEDRLKELWSSDDAKEIQKRIDEFEGYDEEDIEEMKKNCDLFNNRLSK